MKVSTKSFLVGDLHGQRGGRPRHDGYGIAADLNANFVVGWLGAVRRGDASVCFVLVAIHVRRGGGCGRPACDGQLIGFELFAGFDA